MNLSTPEARGRALLDFCHKIAPDGWLSRCAIPNYLPGAR